MNLGIFVRNLATQGAVGYGPIPGTSATIMSVPLAYFLASRGLSVQVYTVICLGLFFLGLQITNYALQFFDEPDPSAIVIDEMVGFLFTFIAVPMNLTTLALGFGFFRLLDIVKPFGIARLEKIDGGLGVMLDDCVAALLSCALLHAAIYFMPHIV